MKVHGWVAGALLAFLGAVPAAQAADWDGVYVGLYAGPNHQQGHATTTTVFSGAGYFASSSVTAIAATGSQSYSASGATFGALIGFNWSIGDRWVTGLEADFGGNFDKDSVSSGAVYPCCAGTGFGIVSKARTRWLFTARPRIGYLWMDDTLAYVTAGLAMTDLRSGFHFSDTFADANANGFFSDTRASWTAGGGIEKQIDSDISVRLEYLYADFGSVSGTSTNLTTEAFTIAWPANVFTHRQSLSEHMVRAAIMLHL